MSDALPITGQPKDREALKQRVLGTHSLASGRVRVPYFRDPPCSRSSPPRTS